MIFYVNLKHMKDDDFQSLYVEALVIYKQNFRHEPFRLGLVLVDFHLGVEHEDVAVDRIVVKA